jgi:hypothetical protein
VCLGSPLAEYRRLRAVCTAPRVGGDGPVRAQPAFVLRVVRGVDRLRAEVACCASGVHALRPGSNRIALVTDGLLECGDRRYNNASRLYNDLAEGDLRAQSAHLLRCVHDARGADSATIVAMDTRAAETKACLTCPVFVTTPDFLDQHRDQLEQTRGIIERAEARGQLRLVEMNQRIAPT